MPAQRRRTAGFDRCHHATLGAAEMVAVGLPVFRAVAVENIRHLQRRAHCAGSGRPGNGIRYDASGNLKGNFWKSPDPYFLDHAMAKRCHQQLLRELKHATGRNFVLAQVEQPGDGGRPVAWLGRSDALDPAILPKFRNQGGAA
jgi:hypothetical protein